MPVRCRDDRFACAKRVSKRAGSNLGFIQVRRYVKVGGSDELFQILELYEFVIEDDVLLDLVILGEHLETDAVRFPVLAQFVRMRGTQDDVNDIGKLVENLRQRLQNILDPLVRRKQTESEQHHLSFHVKLVFEIGGIDETYIGNAMGDKIDLRRRRLVDVLQHLSAAL